MRIFKNNNQRFEAMSSMYLIQMKTVNFNANENKTTSQKQHLNDRNVI
jgi:hypothetical protein